MTSFIAGKDAALFDKSDWDITTIPVYLNPTGLPPTTTVEDAIKMIELACFSWSLRYSHQLKYMGTTTRANEPGAITVNYNSTAQLRQWYGKDVNGLCRYHTKSHNGTKWIMESCEIYINGDNRPLPNRFARATIKHEFGHACGIHGHLNQFGCVMNVSSSGYENLTLEDCQMLDRWNPFIVELNEDFSLACPSVHMPDGHRKWLHLNYVGNGFSHAWRLSKETAWDSPDVQTVTLGDVVIYETQPCVSVGMNDVRSKDLHIRQADFYYAPNGMLILKFAK